MYSACDLQNIVDKEIESLSFYDKPNELYEPISYLMNLKAKRIRPVLTLMCCNMFSSDILDAVKPALGIELFHNFTLAHDDIMDKAPLRRGSITIHEKWSENTAILSGDVMLIKAYVYIAHTPDHLLGKILKIFNEAGLRICEGQQTDMNLEKKNEVFMHEYLKMIENKTAVLLGACCKIGALIGGASEDDAEKLYKFGTLAGLSFQLKDDILDVYGNPDKFGKQKGGDILANKKTFLLIKSMETADHKQKAELQKWMKLNTLHDNYKEKIKSVINLYNELSVQEHGEKQMNKYIEQSLSYLNDISSVGDKSKSVIRRYIQDLYKRER